MAHQFDFMPDELDATKDVLETALRHERERLKRVLAQQGESGGLGACREKDQDLEAALAKLNQASSLV